MLRKLSRERHHAMSGRKIDCRRPINIFLPVNVWFQRLFAEESARHKEKVLKTASLIILMHIYMF